MNKQQNFALIGAAGFVAPRHMRAIKDASCKLVAALDPNDSVGILDSYFPEAQFFTEFERFDRHVDKLRRVGEGSEVNCISICSPNYLHDSHIRFALRSGANAICEKPLVLNTWNLDALHQLERDTGRRVYTILQLRLHPAIVSLKRKLEADGKNSKYEVDLTYVTSRGSWYYQSWKGDERKSGGVATNIGVHFFDMLHFLFGDLQSNIVHFRSQSRAAGYLEFELARVRWFVSIESEDIPRDCRESGLRTCRVMTVDGDNVEFTSGFEDLHSISYREILAGRGFDLETSRVAIDITSDIREQELSKSASDVHPFLRG